MMLSNEPGYYKVGEYGIRIENLILVEPRRIEGADREMFGFETLTFAPIDTPPRRATPDDGRRDRLARRLSRQGARKAVAGSRAETVWPGWSARRGPSDTA